MLRSSLGGVALFVLALLMLAAPPVEAQARRANEPASAAAAAAKVDLNTATGKELESLPGVGPRTAELIIEYREQHDGFQKIEELMNVRGIGERTFLRLRSYYRHADQSETEQRLIVVTGWIPGGPRPPGTVINRSKKKQ